MSASGLSTARLRRLHAVMAGYVERREIPGIVTLVSRRGEVHVDTMGTKMLGGSETVQRDTIFRISSMTKPMIAAAAMLLIEECRLRLDDPVDRLLPELADRRVLKRLDGALDDTVPAERAITVRDLLTFRLGWGLIMAPPDSTPIQRAFNDLLLGQGPPHPSQPPAPDEWLRRLGTLPLLRQPGERWLYNTGSDVLGVLIARAADQSLENFLRERLFAPLGMVDTGFSVPEAQIERLATGYWTNPASGTLEIYDEAVGGEWSRPPAFPSGGGGLVSTVDDYLAFGQMLLRRGKHGSKRLLSRPSVETMTTDQLTSAQKARSGSPLLDFDSHSWGFGMAVVTRRDDLSSVPGRFGWDGGLGTSWWSDPTEDLVGILLTQSAWGSAAALSAYHDFWTSVYQAIDD